MLVLRETERGKLDMEHSLIKLVQETVSSNDAVTWAAYHASTQIEEDQPALTALLPSLLQEGSDSSNSQARYGCPKAGNNLP